MLERWALLINPARIISLHREGPDRYGGDSTQRAEDLDCVDGRLGAAANAAAYCTEGDEDWGLILGAYLLFYLAKDSCFVDGNKRVAWLACMEVLKNLQFSVSATTDEAYDFVIDIVNGVIEVAEVSTWLAERLEDVQGDEQTN